MPSKPIAVVQGAESAAIQRLFRAFVDRHAETVRIAGAIEEGEPGKRKATRLRSLSDEQSYPVFQDLGEGSAGCSLDPRSVVAACESMCAALAAGCDLVIVSKFGKMEALNGSGLLPAFAAAIEAGVPVLTSVAPKFAGEWDRFANPLYETLEATEAALEIWWTTLPRAKGP